MMLRFAAVRPDGSIVRVISASSVEAVDLNVPTGTTKVEAPAEVRFGTHFYDFTKQDFERIAVDVGAAS